MNKYTDEHDEITEVKDGVQLNAGRRKLLKLAGVTGAAVVANAAMPGKWVRPFMDAGVLPAHAQGSPGGIAGLTISDCVAVSTPADIVLTIDVSGSLAGNITTARQALLSFVAARNLSNDQIGLISFDTGVTSFLPLSKDKNAIDAAINSLSSGGLTSIASGIRAATTELTTGAVSGNERIMIIMSDGHTNSQIRVDPVAAQQARDDASAAKAAGIKVITIGIGIGQAFSGVAEALSLMQDMASSSSDFYYVENLDQLVVAMSKGGNC